MTNEQILKKAIEKAKKNGWVTPIWWDGFYGNCNMFHWNRYFIPIFSHSFAKAFWANPKFMGQEMDLVIDDNIKDGSFYFINKKYCKNVSGVTYWQYHLQQMVLEEEPLKYLEKFL